MEKVQKEIALEDDFGVGDYSPLSKEILAEPFPAKFKLPSLDKYDGKSDPCSHLVNFRTTMQL